MMSLDQFVRYLGDGIADQFKSDWKARNQDNPEGWPMVGPLGWWMDEFEAFLITLG